MHSSQFHHWVPGKVLSAVSAFAFCAAVFSAEHTQAAITIHSIENASAVENIETASPVVYGGLAGSATGGTCSSKDNSATCDSCDPNAIIDSGGAVACNNRRIYPSLRFKIVFSSDTVESGIPLVTTNDATNPRAAVALSGSSTTVTKGQQATLFIEWRELCGLIDSGTGSGGTSCAPTSTAKATLRVGVSGDNDDSLTASSDDYRSVQFILHADMGNYATDCSDPNGQGVCYFEVRSGDEKAIIHNLKAVDNSGFPNTTGVQFKFLRVYYSDSGYNDIRPTTLHQDLEISSSDGTSFSVSPARITNNIQNHKVYFFKTALVDAAGNIGLFTPASGNLDCSFVTPSTSECHEARPAPVAGVLSENSNCFIATAAYGSEMAPQVNIFRSFRDHYLLQTSWGKSFVRFYYEHSPEYANWIAQSETLRAGVRTLLWPLLAFASLSLKLGPALTTLIFSMAFTLIFASLISISKLYMRPRAAVVARERRVRD